MFGLTNLGLIHTAISLVALTTGIWAMLRDGEISSAKRLGQIYGVTTILTCLSAFGIFQHGGFGKGHGLAVITLITLALIALASRTTLFGRLSRYIITLGFSATLLFHLIPGITETSTRLPLGHPLLPSAEAPALKLATGLLLLGFIAIALLQARRLRQGRPQLEADG